MLGTQNDDDNDENIISNHRLLSYNSTDTQIQTHSRELHRKC